MKAPTTRAVMVGRQSDLQILRDALTDATRGVPRCVVLSGEAGMGKTRLLSEFRAEIGADALVLSADCIDLGPLGVPFGPVRSIMRQLISAVGVDAVLAAAGPGRAAVTALLPELESGQDDPGEGEEPLPETFMTLLDVFSRDRTVVLIVDDMHWADAATLSFLSYVLRSATIERALVVLAYRVEDTRRGHPLRRMLVELERARAITRQELNPLDEFEVADLITRLRGSEADGETIAGITRRTGGVPFFVEELVGLGGDRIPETLRDVLLARYERLDPEVQAFVRAVAVGGMNVDHRVIAAVLENANLDELARPAIDETVLLRHPEAYQFRHALVREAIYDELLPGERRKLHEEFARVLEELDAPASETSFHWFAAHDLPRALHASASAFDQAEASHAYASALQLGERALELWDSVPDPESVAGRTKAELLMSVTSAARDAGDSKRGLALVTTAIDATPEADTVARARLLQFKAELLSEEGILGAEEVYVEALAVLGDSQEDLELRARLQSSLANRYLLSGRNEQSRELFEQSLAVARHAGSGAMVSKILLGLGWLEAVDGNFVSMRALYAESLEQAGDGVGLLLYGTNATDTYVQLGEYQTALDVAAGPILRARELGLERRWGGILSNSVDALIGLGQWDEAAELGRQVLALNPDGCSIANQHRRRILIASWQDDIVLASEIAHDHSQLLETFSSHGDLQDVFPIAGTMAELALFQGRLDDAWRQVSIVWDQPHEGGTGYDLPLLGLAARIIGEMRRQGMPDPMAGVEKIELAFEGLAEWAIVPRWRAFVEAELAGGSDAEAEAHAWRTAADALDESMPAHIRAYGSWRLGQAQLRAGDRAAAAESLQHAIELSEPMRATWVSGQARKLLETAALGERVQDDQSQLTARERQVLELIVEGLSNKEIAQRLFISTKTASVHVSAILRKLGATTRTQAAVMAQREVSA